MRTVHRLGVHLDQCEGCGGIFLDRGELERTTAAEQRYYAAPRPYPPEAVHGSRPDSPPPFRAERYRSDPDPPSRKRRRGFLEDLFD